MRRELALYLLSAAAVVLLVALGPASVGYSLLIAWFAWLGGVLFGRLFLQPTL